MRRTEPTTRTGCVRPPRSRPRRSARREPRPPPRTRATRRTRLSLRRAAQLAAEVEGRCRQNPGGERRSPGGVAAGRSRVARAELRQRARDGGWAVGASDGAYATSGNDALHLRGHPRAGDGAGAARCGRVIDDRRVGACDRATRRSAADPEEEHHRPGRARRRSGRLRRTACCSAVRS
jgi:hypothetical protein